MEQYIKREQFLKKSAECFGHFGVLVKAIEEIANECTTADVVPKSEVEKIFEEIEKKLKENINYISENINHMTDPDAIDGQYETIDTLEWALSSIAELKKKRTEVAE